MAGAPVAMMSHSAVAKRSGWVRPVKPENAAATGSNSAGSVFSAKHPFSTIEIVRAVLAVDADQHGRRIVRHRAGGDDRGAAPCRPGRRSSAHAQRPRSAPSRRGNAAARPRASSTLRMIPGNTLAEPYMGRGRPATSRAVAPNRMLPMQSAAFTSAVDDLPARQAACPDHVAPDAGFACARRLRRRWRWLPAGAQADGLLIGVAAPLTGPSARLGAQVRAGAAGGGSFGNLGGHARHRRRSVLGRWRRQGGERFRRGQGERGRRLPLHRIDRSGDADPEGRRHPGDHGRRAHQQPDRPQGQDRLAGVPAGAALRRGRGCGGLDAGRAVAAGILRHHRRRHHLRPRARRDAALRIREGRPDCRLRRSVPAAARQPDRPCRPPAQGRRDACLRRRRPRRHRDPRARRGRSRL